MIDNVRPVRCTLLATAGLVLFLRVGEVAALNVSYIFAETLGDDSCEVCVAAEEFGGEAVVHPHHVLENENLSVNSIPGADAYDRAAYF